MKVIALEHIVHVETVLLHVVHQILRGIAVIPDLERVDLIPFHQFLEPVETIVVVYEVVPGREQEASLDVEPIRNTVTLLGFLDLLRREPEPRKDEQFSVLLDNRCGRCQVSRLRQVYAANAVCVAEVLKIQSISAGLFDHLRG